VPGYSGGPSETPGYGGADYPSTRVPSPYTSTGQTTVPYTPPSGQPQQRPRAELDGDDRDDDDDELPEAVPKGTRFRNPVASGSAFLFGTNQAQELSSNLLPVKQDESGQSTGDVGPITVMGQAALETEESVLGFEFDDENSLF